MGSRPRFETKQVHSGAKPDPVTNARATPIYQTTSYVFNDTEHAAEPLRARRVRQHLHAHHEPDDRTSSSSASPRSRAASARSPWHPARPPITYAVLNIAGAGDHIVSSSSIYGGTYNLFKYTLAKLGIEVTFVENQDEAEWAAAVRPNTKLFFAETIGNPKINILDIETVSGVAHENGVPLIVDNTIATPYLIRPFEVAPTSSCTPRPSSSAATARSSPA